MDISISQDNVNFTTVPVNSLQEFVNYATSSNYSTGTFKDHYRTKANFVKAECIAIDVDNDDETVEYTIENAKEVFSGYKHIILPSKSHQKEKNGRVADRFRVILFLESPITSAKDFTATWHELLKLYPGADHACKDASRFYYPSPDVYSINETGKLWGVTEYTEPEIDPLDAALLSGYRGQLSKSTLNFLAYGAPAGKRNLRLFKAAKDMQEQRFTIDECKARVSSMIQLTGNWETTYLNDTDLMTINNAYKNIPMHAPREGEMTRRSVFKFQTIGEMTREAGEVQWLADKLLSVAGFSMIVGPPKAGKSTLVRQLVKAVCQGSQFLGREVKQGSVLYLTFEEQASILKEQFRLVGITENDPIMIHTGAVFDNRALTDLEEDIHYFSPQLVVLDTIFDISQLESINDYKAVKDALSRIRAIARNTDAHILGVHHTNKGGGFMGSQAIFGAVDTMITFVQQRERRYLYSSGKHGEHFDDHEILFNATTQSYTLGNKGERVADKL